MTHRALMHLYELLTDTAGYARELDEHDFADDLDIARGVVLTLAQDELDEGAAA